MCHLNKIEELDKWRSKEEVPGLKTSRYIYICESSINGRVAVKKGPKPGKKAEVCKNAQEHFWHKTLHANMA